MRIGLVFACAVALAAAWWYVSDQDDAAARAKTLSQITNISQTLTELNKSIAEEKLFTEMRHRAANLGNPDFSEQVRKAWLDNLRATCELELRLRQEIGPIEAQVRQGNRGELPPWFTQSRDWQMIDAHIRQSKFIAPKQGCN